MPQKGGLSRPCGSHGLRWYWHVHPVHAQGLAAFTGVILQMPGQSTPCPITSETTWPSHPLGISLGSKSMNSEHMASEQCGQALGLASSVEPCKDARIGARMAACLTRRLAAAGESRAS